MRTTCGFHKLPLFKTCKQFVPTPTDLQQPRMMVFVARVRCTYAQFGCIFWVPLVQKENTDLQSTVSASDPWQKGSAFSAGAVVEVQRNSSSVSISGVWQVEHCFSILHSTNCLQMTSIFWSICWLSHFSRFGLFSQLCFEKNSLSSFYFVTTLLLLLSFWEKLADVSGVYPMK